MPAQRIYQAISLASGSGWIGGGVGEWQAGLLVRPSNWRTSTQAFGDSALKALVVQPTQRCVLDVSAYLSPPGRTSAAVLECVYGAIAANAGLQLWQTTTTFPSLTVSSLIIDSFIVQNNSANPLYLHASQGPDNATGIAVAAGATSATIPMGLGVGGWRITGATNAVAAGAFIIFMIGRQRALPQALAANLYVIPPEVVGAGTVIPNIASTLLLCVPMRTNRQWSPDGHWYDINSNSPAESTLVTHWCLDRPISLPPGHGLGLGVDFVDELVQNNGPNTSSANVVLAGVLTGVGSNPNA